MNTKTKTLYFSYLTLLSCFLITIGHCNAFFWTRPTGIRWVYSLLIESICNFPIGMFFMISGATLMDYRKRYSTLEFFKKRFIRTGIPFIFWYLFGTFWPYLSIDTSGSFPKITAQLPCSFIQAMYGMADDRFSRIYWFFLALFSCYLLIPIFSRFKRRDLVFNSVIAVLFVLHSIIPLVCMLTGIPNNITPHFFFQPEFFMYVLLGYQLANKDISVKWRKIIYAGGFVGVFFHLFGTAYLSYGLPVVNAAFKGHINVPPFLMAVAVFVRFKYTDFAALQEKYPLLRKFVYEFSGCTFGVYLIHNYFVIGIPELFGFDSGNFFWLIFGSLGIYFGCLYISRQCKRLPVLRYLIP